MASTKPPKKGEHMKTDMWKRAGLAVLLSLSLVLLGVMGGISAAGTGAQLAEQFLKKTPVTAVDQQMSLKDAVKAQEEFISVISEEFGQPVGYKAGLTNPNVQKAFGLTEPVRGTLLKKMLLPNGSVVSADFGAVPVSEGDLIVRVGNEAINQAKTPEEALKSLDAVIPFIELPDMVFEKSVKPTGAAIVAINVGARYGIMGAPIILSATPEWQERLRNFTLQILDEKGTPVAEGKGSSLLGDPLSVVVWLKDSLAAQGMKLKKGDLLSLGTITKPMPAKPGTVIKAKYIGLDPKGPVEISVSFK
jgi:2-keto-4-pentenoate hydratase